MCSSDLLYGVGISREGSLIDFGVEHGIVKKSGAWYTYEGDQLGQGKEKARDFLMKNAEIANEIEQKILKKLGVGAYKQKPEEQVAQAPAGAPVESLQNRAPVARKVGA